MGRRSGVVITLVRKQLTTVVENTEVDFDNILLLKLSGSVFNVDRVVFLIYCYVCPNIPHITETKTSSAVYSWWRNASCM